jgi:hypothetical protein
LANLIFLLHHKKKKATRWILAEIQTFQAIQLL